LEPIKKKGNLEAYSIVKNLRFYGFYDFSEDKYLKKPTNASKIESNYYKLNKFKNHLFRKKT
jgi:hypothetical protein